MRYFARICANAQSWREFAKCRFAHFPSFFSVHVDTYDKRTGKDQDYVVYKEALNAATNEVRKSKRNFELKLAQNIKSDSKSFYAYVRSKQNVRDKVGPL